MPSSVAYGDSFSQREDSPGGGNVCGADKRGEEKPRPRKLHIRSLFLPFPGEGQAFAGGPEGGRRPQRTPVPLPLGEETPVLTLGR